MKNCFTILLLSVVFSSCKLLPDELSPKDEPPSEVLISQFERVGYSDLLIDKNGTYHAVFQESPAIGKPVYIYYSSSSNGGKSWSKPIALSDDGTGNGSGYPQLIEDGQGLIYAIWKRYGNTKLTQPEIGLDGPGGNVGGTLMYKVLQGSGWSSQKRLADNDMVQISWFADVDDSGSLRVVWSQVSNETAKANFTYYWYADWIRMATLTGTSFTVQSLTNPLPPEYNGGPPKKLGYRNLDGYFDAQGKLRFTGEVMDGDGVPNLIYYNGTGGFTIYKYPKYGSTLSFMNPPRLVSDEKGIDHVVFQPESSTVITDQIWDITPHNAKKKILGEISDQNAEIQNYQVFQGPGGKFGLVIQAGGLVESNQTLGIFYSDGNYENISMSNNPAKESFFTKEFQTLNGKTAYLSVLKLFLTSHTSIAYDKNGNKKALMTLSEESISGGFRVSNPSLYFISVD